MFDSTPPLFTRHAGNPILQPSDWPVGVNTVFNPAAVMAGEETFLLCRVEDTRGMSHLWAARSSDGIGDWRVDPAPLLSPDPDNESEQWGFEDARMVRVDELDRWAITCTAYGPTGPAVYLATTDLHTVERDGILMPPEDKNASLFPRRINGDWVLLHRPVTLHASHPPEVWLSRSRDLESWRRPERVLRTRQGAWWDAVRIGIGPPPIETPEGWLLLYHGVRQTPNGALYRVGLALLDLDNPTVVRARAPGWVFAPQEPYERVGDVPNVVFPCGFTLLPDGDTLRLYYGAADTVVALATARVSELLDHVLTTG